MIIPEEELIAIRQYVEENFEPLSIDICSCDLNVKCDTEVYKSPYICMAPRALYEDIEYPTWQQLLFEIIDNNNLNEVEVYKRACVSKQTFSKIRSNIYYQPQKDTVIQLCIGLQLHIDDALEFLDKAGFTLSCSIKRDLYIRKCIIDEKYNIDYVNSVLYQEGFKILIKKTE